MLYLYILFYCWSFLLATWLDHRKEEKKNYAYNWVVEDHCRYVSN